jgi:hypothetical protein
MASTSGMRSVLVGVAAVGLLLSILAFERRDLHV